MENFKSHHSKEFYHSLCSVNTCKDLYQHNICHLSPKSKLSTNEIQEIISDFESAKSDPYFQIDNLRILYLDFGISYLKGKIEVSQLLDNFSTILSRLQYLGMMDTKFAALVYNNRALKLRLLGQFDRAIQDYTKSLEIDPHYSLAIYNRGISYSLINETELAMKDYCLAIELDPSDCLSWNNRGGIYYDQRLFDLAEMDFTRSIEINPSQKCALYNRYLCFVEKGRHISALCDIIKVVNECCGSSGEGKYVDRMLREINLLKFTCRDTLFNEGIDRDIDELNRIHLTRV